MIAETALGLVIVAGVYFDLRERRIPNWVTMPGLAAGLVISWLSGGSGGLLVALGGAAVGAALLSLPYALHWMGGGDLKLLAAVGSLMGASFTLSTLLFGLAVSGAMALVWMVVTGNLAGSLKYLFLVWLPVPSSKPLALSASIPFGPALAAGALISLFWR